VVRALMHALGIVLMFFGPVIFIMIACWYMLGPCPQTDQQKFDAMLNRPLPRHECECSDCMEPGLRGPDTTSLGER
jgi:hypothetical protein